MTIPDYSWHQKHTAHATMTEPAFDRASSLFPPSVFSYSAAYDSLALGYDFGLGSLGSDVYCGSNVSPQQVFGQQATYPAELQPTLHDLDNEASPQIKLEADGQESQIGSCHDGIGVELQLPPAAHPNPIGTHVDTLMKTIQTKASRSSDRMQLAPTERRSASSDLGSSSTDSSARNSSSARRKYPCKLQSCAKVFTQKTHLEIHTRAHTGYKPFVRPLEHYSHQSVRAY